MKHFYPIILTSLAVFLLNSCFGQDNSDTRTPFDGDARISEYVSEFNAVDDEIYKQAYPNVVAADFMKENIPVLDCPDKNLELTYYFRWWTFRKHIKKIPSGFILTEFLPDVPWAGNFNAINCPAAHHLAEGRWLRNPQYLNDYARFWCFESDNPRRYSFPISDAFLKLYAVHQNISLIQDTYTSLKQIYADWDSDHKDANGLYWQMDGYDGMEVSISGSLSPDATGYRPTINSYMYADASAISVMAGLLGHSDDAHSYGAKAAQIKGLIDTRLWDPEARFYKVIPRHRDGSFSHAREEIGFVPWLYGIPDADKSDAWLQLKDEQGFKAPFGPTTAEQRADGFKVVYEGHECQWNGPSWPFATSQTLTALAALLHRDGEGVMTKADYYEALTTYSDSHRRVNEDGKTVCWIDENLNPFTGDWISRTMLLANGTEYKERGKDYNHSTFCDLVISGLIGVQPQVDGSIVIEPLLPEGAWDYFCLSRIRCAGKDITVMFDRNGDKYGMGKGFRVLVDGKTAAVHDTYAVKVIL